MSIASASLVIYSFAHKQLPSDAIRCEEAKGYLRHLWDVCDGMGMKDAVAGFNLDTTFPDNLSSENPVFRLAAAKMDQESHAKNIDHNAFLFEYQDIIGLVVSFQSDGANGGVSYWQEIYQNWKACAGGDAPPQASLGEIYVFSGLLQENEHTEPWLSADHHAKEVGSVIGEELFAALPGSQGDLWRAVTFQQTDNEFYLWEGETLDERRVLAVIARESEKDELFEWMVWAGQDQPAFLVRYLIHTSKARFAEQVYDRDIYGLRNARIPMDQALHSLLELKGGIESEQYIQPKNISSIQKELNRIRGDSYRLLYGISQLKEMRLTTQIAQQNIRQLLPPSVNTSITSPHAPFAQDLARVEWLVTQIDFDLGYLQALRERVEEGYKFITLRLEFEAQKNARRLSDLVLLQGSLVGAIIVALTAIQSFQLKLPVDASIYWPFAGMLVGLALSLPALLTHWHEGLRKRDFIAGGISGASVTWFATMFWSVYMHSISKHVSYELWVAYEIFTTLLGFLLTYTFLVMLSRRRVSKSASSEEVADGQ